MTDIVTEANHLTCEVCGQEPALGVACVPGVPMSVAYGRSCLDRGVHPYGLMRANVACAGGVDATSPEYLQFRVLLNGEAMTLAEALQREPLTERELKFDETEYGNDHS